MTFISTDFADVVGQLEGIYSVAEALAVIKSAYEVDFVTYHLASTITGAVDAPFVRTTYPDSWVARYLLNGYVSVDPVVREGFLRQLPFDWREIEIMPEDIAFLEDAKRHGVGDYGYSIPVADKSCRRAILSFNTCAPSGGWDARLATFRGEWQEIAHLVHAKAVQEIQGGPDPLQALSARERECLRWSALGKDYKDIALILGLSEHTIRSYLKSARHKLGCATVTAAATLAHKLRFFSI